MGADDSPVGWAVDAAVPREVAEAGSQGSLIGAHTESDQATGK